MSRIRLLLDAWLSPQATTVVAPILVAVNVLFSITSQVSFKQSALSPAWRPFLTWQIVANLAGFASVLALTGLLRLIPLHVATPLTLGLTVVGVQVVAARLLFGENISAAQWAGTLFVVLGIALIAGKKG